MKDKAMKQALEALELTNAEWRALADSGDSGHWHAEDQDHYKQTQDAITALKEALAQPEQEPLTNEQKKFLQQQFADKFAAINFTGKTHE